MKPKILALMTVPFALGVGIGIAGSLLFISGHAGVARLAFTEPTGSVTSASGTTSTYRNDSLGFSLSYPSELAVDEYDEGDGARTIVFRKGEEDFGFQIFVVAYRGQTISQDQLERDTPGLEIRDAETVLVGTGTPALAFASNAPAIGASRELWFVHRGYLFQVTTYPHLAAWLADIMRSWQPIQ